MPVKAAMNRLIASLFLLLALPLAAQEASESSDESADDKPLTTPAQRAAESDYVVLAQLHIYKYETRRDIPVEGDTWFDVLVPYKVPMPVERMKVVEEGFGEGKCYFDDVELFNEMPRYLLFLVDNPEGEAGEVRGHPDGCAVPVATTTDNRYVVRWPIENMRFEGDVESLVQEYELHGPGAFVDLSDLVGYRREEEIERLHLVEAEDDRGRDFIYRYTRGIPLSDFRSELIGAENLTLDRVQRGN
jgi:hypothetical protein